MSPQEPDEIPRRVVLLVAAAACATGILASLLAGLPARRVEITKRPPPPPVVEQSLAGVAERGRDVQAAKRAELGRYGWVDRDRGIAKIPIDRAIDLVIAESQ